MPDITTYSTSRSALVLLTGGTMRIGTEPSRDFSSQVFPLRYRLTLVGDSTKVAIGSNTRLQPLSYHLHPSL